MFLDLGLSLWYTDDHPIVHRIPMDVNDGFREMGEIEMGIINDPFGPSMKYDPGKDNGADNLDDNVCIDY